jgi:CRISPR-associated protein Cas6
MTYADDSDAAPATMVDMAFELQGRSVPRDHRRALADALDAALPWLAQAPGAGVHRLNLSAGGGPQALLSRRTRLVLRLPRDRAGDAAALQGRTLVVGEDALHVGPGHVRELLPWGTLYAHFVAAAEEGDAGEAVFLDAVNSGLQALGVAGRAICGRRQSIEGGRLAGYGLMIDGLAAAASLRVQEAGLGAHRLLGCGVFVPHKSAAAVGAPP